MAKRGARTASGGKYTLPDYACRRCSSTAVAEARLGTRRAHVCTGCGNTWGDEYLLGLFAGRPPVT